jgi:hypothetical protein
MTRAGGHSNSGGVKAPRRSNGHIDWERVYSEHVKGIIENQIAPNTNRGIMYILESQKVLKKSDYGGLTDHLIDWRKDGRINWNEIADGSGRGVFNDFNDYQEPYSWITGYIDYLKKGGDAYRSLIEGRWRWHGQPYYVEHWSEKHAVVGTIAAHIEDTYVRVAFNRGNPGWGYMHDNCERLERELWYTDLNTNELRTRKGIYVFYMGDDDKYGRDMDRQIKEQLDHFGLSRYVHFERIAVIPSQVQEYGLPVDFESGKGYEIDALNAFNPVAFKQLLLDHIEPYFDKDIHKRLLELNPAKKIDRLIRSKIKFQADKSKPKIKEYSD